MRGGGVTISTKLYDPVGFVEFLKVEDAANIHVSRRVNSTATLDGGSFVSDTGYSATDKKLDYVVSDVDSNLIDNWFRISKLHSRLYVCNREGAFEVIVRSTFYNQGKLKINFVVVAGAS